MLRSGYSSEAVLRERRLEKASRKQIRKQAQLDTGLPDEPDAEAPEAGVDTSVPSTEPPASM